MKFGKHLETRQLALPEYNGHFIDYKSLKKLIKQLSLPAVGSNGILETGDESLVHQVLQEHKASFFFRLERELEKVNAYYLEKEADLRIKFDILRLRFEEFEKRGKLASKNTVSYRHLRDGIKKFERDLAHLEQFVELNRTGFSKVLKKWDKRSHSHTKDFYLATVVSVQPVFTRNEASELNDAVSVILMQLNEIGNSEDFFSGSFNARTVSTSYARVQDIDPVASSVASYSLSGGFKPQTEPDFFDIGTEIESWYLEALSIGKLKDEEPRWTLLRDFPQQKVQAFVESHVPHSRIDKNLIVRDALTKIFLLLVSSSIDDESLRVFFESAGSSIDLSYTEEDDVVFSKRNIFHEAAICEPHSRGFILLRALDQCKGSASFESTLRTLLNAQDANGRTPLHYACDLGKMEFVKLLLNSNLLDSVDILDNDSKTPLVLSVIKNQPEITEALLVLGHANPSPSVKDSGKPQFAPLNVACAYQNFAAAKLILDFSNFDLSAVQDSHGLCPLHIVAKNGGDAKMIELLVSHGSDPNRIDGFNGWTPVFYAIQEGHRNTVEELLKHGASIDIYDEDNLSPYFYALWEGHLSVVNLLRGHCSQKTDTTNPSMDPLRSVLEPTTVMRLEDSLHGIPDFTLPPPIIPLRKYGHNFLEKKIFVNLSFRAGTASIVLNKEDEMVLSSPGRITLTSNVSDIIPRNVILPTEDDDENFVVFQVDSLDGFSIDFEIFPSFGTRMIAKTTAMSSLFKGHDKQPSSKGAFILPLFDARLKNVGELVLDYTFIFPYSGRPLEITKYETYWKSTTGNETGKSGNQFITSSLSGTYTNFFLFPLNDGTLIVSPKKAFSTGPMDLKIFDLNANQLEKLMGYSLQGNHEGSKEVTYEQLLNERFTTLETLLNNTPPNAKLEIEVCFPTACEFESIPLKLSPLVNINDFIDNVLSSSFAHARQRFHNGMTSSIVFTSRNPEVCSILNWKQPNFPVLFYMNGLRKENGVLVKDTPHHLSHLSMDPEKVNYKEPCSRCIREAVQFASYNNLLGVIVPLELLRSSQQLVSEIRGRGLLVIGSLFEGENIAVDLAGEDINGVRTHDTLQFKGSIDM
ncbi:Pho81p [Lachancea thermotolerans CBS 6340]|uniref:KLTH0C01628p n=1 Tax=Lachancea thermotolerans (strain ATCC 56472 / CBS 6340 / NRRL Y-8284) TaxID=559295 RepID=C5DDK0_LACTC|nr:KLTH0C01628p [Lachancea thermotolerans CBS 6340]CAR21861.1 KLTH0C01628p [Lachancea thermotolerans CBS 6340]